ncbi:DgyrCDS7520 [Dimorphilus gyrociliatus]|uniref:Large ribosomal subunit protein uL22m n=1 Tax=Dimorphilus gyrociliatus TaxID=2664684 RepID=A0A7I8VW76_9ANNE|nr:DgyrCDS7520 [Dimorphilus gyrociliatus]
MLATISRLTLNERTWLPAVQCISKYIHTTDINLQEYHKIRDTKVWNRMNEIVYPPQRNDEKRRPAEIWHSRENIKYSYKKLWYIAAMIRGMSIDEALKQLSFYPRKGAIPVREVLLEAQEKAVLENNVEFKSNLWIAESKVERGLIVKGIRKHARMRFGTIHYRYTNYFVKLQEGNPPKDYYTPVDPSGKEKYEEKMKNLRKRTIIFGL